MDASIRPATRGDLPAIHDIYNDAILTTTATWDEEPWPMARREAWWEEHAADPTTPVFVAEGAAGAVSGFAYLSWYRAKSGYRFTRENTVYVDPRFHRQGLGLALLEALVREAQLLGLHAIVASIEAENAASIALHRRLGFFDVGREREVGFKFGRWLDAVYLELLLGR